MKMELRNDIQCNGNSKEPQKMDIVGRVISGNVGGENQGFPQKQRTFFGGIEEDEFEIEESIILKLLRKLDRHILKWEPVEELSEKIMESSPPTTHTKQVKNEVPSGNVQNFNNFQNLDPVCATTKLETNKQIQYKHIEEAGEVNRTLNSCGLKAPKLVHRPVERVFHVPIKIAKEEFKNSENVENSVEFDFMDSFEEFLISNMAAAEVSKVTEVENELLSKNNLVATERVSTANEIVKAKVHVPIKEPKEDFEDIKNSDVDFEEFLLNSPNVGIEVMSSHSSLSPGRKTYNLLEAPAIVRESNEEIHDYNDIGGSVGTGSGIEDNVILKEGEGVIEHEGIYYCNSFKETGNKDEAPRQCDDVKLIVKIENTEGQIHSDNNGGLPGFRSEITVKVEDECNDFKQFAHNKITEAAIAEIEMALSVDDFFLRVSDDTKLPAKVLDEVEVLACRSFIAEEMDAILEETSNGTLHKHILLEPSEIVTEQAEAENEIQEDMKPSEGIGSCSNIEESSTSEKEEKIILKHGNTVEIEEQLQRQWGGKVLLQHIPVEAAEIEIYGNNNGERSENVTVEIRNENMQFISCTEEAQGEELKKVNLRTNEIEEDVIVEKIEVSDNKIQYGNDCKLYEIIKTRGAEFIVIDETLGTSVIEETQIDESKDNEELYIANMGMDETVEELKETRKRQGDELEELGPSTKIIRLEAIGCGRDLNKETTFNEEQATSDEADQKTAPEIIIINSDFEETPDVMVIPDENQSAPSTKETQKRKCDNSEEHAPSPKIAKVEQLQVQKQVTGNIGLREAQITRSRPNPALTRVVFGDPMTSTWQFTSHYPYMLCNLIKQTAEYERVKKIFKKTATRRMAVSRIYRVENPYLLGMYLMKKEKMKRSCDRSHQVIERQLFHGTRQENIDGICRYNFDWRRRGQSRGHKFGQGVSFSPKASYARHYNFGDDVMFLAKVLVSRTVEGGRDTVVPPEPYDTTRNGTGDVIVKYDDDDFYPQYVIYYYYRQDCGFFFGF